MQKSNEVLTLKPYRDNYIAWVIDFWLVYVVLCVVGIILSIVVGEAIPWLIIGIGFLIYIAGVSLIALIARLCYRGKLIVTADGVIKLHGKKVQFKIKREDIVSVCVRKMNPVLKLLVILSAFIGFIISSAFSAILVYAQELLPFKVGLVSGIFFGFAFGIAGVASAILGEVADIYGIEFVYVLCSFFPLFGIVAYFLPRVRTIQAMKKDSQ